MAYIQSQSSNPLHRLGLIARTSEIAAEIKAAYVQHKEFTRTLNELRGLSTRELNDLGLNRSNLRQIAWETVQTQATDRKPV